MKKFIRIMTAAILMPTLLLFTACGSLDDGTAGDDTEKEKNPGTPASEGSGKHHAEIVIRDYGTITVELDEEAAPITVENFINLAKSGFYDGLTFHRIIKGFMMQGGASSEPADTIKGEFSNNGVDNPLAHTRGAISMARTNAPNSASSQFFICHKDSPHLNGDYACFGYVTSGIEVVDAVCESARPIDGNGKIAADEQPVIERITIID